VESKQNAQCYRSGLFDKMPHFVFFPIQVGATQTIILKLFLESLEGSQIASVLLHMMKNRFINYSNHCKSFCCRQLSLATAEDAALEPVVTPPRNSQKIAPKKITPRRRKNI
jgi:hypothetical protein